MELRHAMSSVRDSLASTSSRRHYRMRLHQCRICHTVIGQAQKCHNGGILIPWPACLLTGPMINEQLSAEQRAELLDKIPVKKFCTPEEIAHTVDYLISPLAGFVTVRCVSLRLLIILLHVPKYH